MKTAKRLTRVLLSVLLMLLCVQAVYAAENTMQVVFEDVTDSADTLMGEAKVKISIKETGGDISASQLKFVFSGKLKFNSELVAQGGLPTTNTLSLLNSDLFILYLKKSSLMIRIFLS